MGSKPSKGQIINVQPIVKEESPDLPDRNELVAIYHGIYDVKLHNVERNSCKVSSMAFLPTGDLLLADQSNSALKLLSRSFKYETHLNLPGRPHDLCIYSSNYEGSDIYLTLPRERTVLEVYVEGRKLILGNTFKTENWCYGITAYKEGLLIIVGTKLKFIDVNSKFIKTINFRKIGESPFGSPCYLDAMKDRYILISDSLKHALYCIDEDGNELFRYTEMYFPHGIVNVGKETLCLAGRSSETSDVLQQVTDRGEKVRTLLPWKTVRFTPLALSYRASDRLLVIGGNNDRIKTFKLLPCDFKREGWISKLSIDTDSDINFSTEIDEDFSESESL